jgi:uncharacterized protein (DUF2252 family)
MAAHREAREHSVRTARTRSATGALMLRMIVARHPVDHENRLPRLRELRALKMARSAHAFVRGSTARFYEWLASESAARLPAGPPVWICGDCHVGNLGPVGRTEGSVVVEIRDLDQSVIGNPAHDLTRLALSLAMAARACSLPGVATARITEDLVAGYEAAFDGAIPAEHVQSLPSPIRVVMKRAMKRGWKHLLKERIGKPAAQIPLGRRFWPLTADERVAIAKLIESPRVHSLVTRLESRDDASEVELVDAAYWVKGCSSLGLWRAAVVVDVIDRSRKKDEGRRVRSLLDIKEATKPSAPAHKGADMPDEPAARVVAGALRVAPALGERMLATELLGRSVFIRELLPQDLKLELDELSSDDARASAYYLGMVVGRAHARQMAPADRDRWFKEIESRRTKNIDAPGWLWEAVVDLVGVHERAYLEHCRRYALDQDKVQLAA